jgi:protein SCO1
MQPRISTLLVVGVSLAVVVLGAATMSLQRSQQKSDRSVTRLIGGAFELVDQDGRTVTERDLLGKPSAIFFGFTYCPDICPTTLLEMTNWLKALGPDGDKLNVVFVSVDSERDTPAQLKSYLASFDPRIRGFTGTSAQIQKITQAYRVYYKRVALDDGGFTYDHSALIYLMNAMGEYVGPLRYEEADNAAVNRLRELITDSR